MTLGCSGQVSRDAAFMDSLSNQGYPCCLSAVVENDVPWSSGAVLHRSKKRRKGRKWVVPLNSNWTGIPDTLETVVLEIPNYSAWKQLTTGALRFNTENSSLYQWLPWGIVRRYPLLNLLILRWHFELQVVQERRLMKVVKFLMQASCQWLNIWQKSSYRF